MLSRSTPTLIAAIAGSCLSMTVAAQLTGVFPPAFNLSALNGSNGFVLNGIDAGDLSGWSVSSAGDVNGDGMDDLLIAARDADPNGNSIAGESYVVFGGVGVGSAGSVELSSLDGSNGFVLNGIDADDRSGWSVSSAGDINGDGVDDLLIGARDADPNGSIFAGESYVVFGGVGVGSAGSVEVSSLDGSNGFVLNGIDADDRSGCSVSSAGDINGDGVDDLLIGARDADPNGNSIAGESYVVFGGVGVGSAGSLELSSLDGSNGFVLNGIDVDDRSGWSVSSAGDVNGDGIEDLIIGAELADPNGNFEAGESYVVFGAANIGSSGSMELSALNGSNGFVLNGIDAGDRSGTSVSSAGDVNNDGVGDLIIGASYADPNGNSIAGESYVVFGGTGVGSLGVIDLSSLNGSNGFVLNGIDAGDFSGWSVSSAGDVNGDGMDDLLIGARYADPNGNSAAGESYVVFGGTGVGSLGVIDLSGLNGSNGFVLNGIDGGDLSGSSVSSAGDVNGDGVDDLIIGAPNGNDNAGESYVVFGRVTQTWGRSGGGAFEVGSNWASGTAPQTGIVVIEPQFGGTVTLTEQVDLFLDALVLGSELGVTTLDIGTASLLSIASPFTVHSSAAISGEGVLVAESGMTNAGVIDFDGLLTGSIVNLGTVESAALVFGDVRNEALIDLDGRRGSGSIARFKATGIVTNTAGGEMRLSRGGIEIEAARFANGGDVNAAFTQARLGGPVENSGPAPVPSGFIINGTDAGDQSGFSVSSAGDVNGDGVDDLVIGARRGRPNGNRDAGESYVVFGSAGISSSGFVELSSLDGTDGFVLNGIDVADYSGRSVSSAGDVNGDGIGDLIIGGYNGDPNGTSDAGESYVIFGGPNMGQSGAIDLSSLNGSNGFVLGGIDPFDRSGWSVSSAGDVNGDGMDDLLIGARYADPNGVSSGESYIVFGGTGVGSFGVIDLSGLNGSDGFVLNGIDADDQSGASVSSAGDVNGDGIDDFIIGALNADPSENSDAGESYVVFGGVGVGSAGSLELSSLNGSNGFVLNGIDAGDRSGVSVSSAGDVNGDGISDLIIGAVGADPNGTSDAGESYIVFGGMSVGSSGAVELSSLDGSNGFVLDGIDADDRSGWSVSSAGDINGDGVDDLLIGARDADPNGNIDSGESYVVFGGVGVGSAGSVEVSSLDGSNGFVLNGIDADDRSGWSVSSAGDVNGDGMYDVIISAYRADPNGNTNAGEGYVVFGRGSAPYPASIDLAELPQLMFEGTGPGRFTIAGGSEIFFTESLSNTGSVVLNADSEIVLLGSLSGNGVNGPFGPGSAGPVFAFDSIFPGPAPIGVQLGVSTDTTGIMRFDGDLLLSSSSRTALEIVGPTPGAGHDQIVVAGTLGAAGTLDISLINGFVPQPGTTLQLLEFGDVSGGFAAVQLAQELIDLNADISQLAVTGELIIPGGGGCSVADLAEPFGTLDIDDVLMFLNAFATMDALADLAPPTGTLDIDDVLTFLSAFANSCP